MTAASAPAICLIGGTGRSGTTVLRELFSAHPDVAAAPELRFPVDPDGLLDFYVCSMASWSPYIYDSRVRRLERMLRDMGRHRAARRTLTYVAQELKFPEHIPFNLVPRYSGVAIERHSPNFLALVDDLMEALVEFTYRGQWNGSRFLSSNQMSFAKRPTQAHLAKTLGAFWRAVIEDICKASGGASHFVEDDPWNLIWLDTALELLPEIRLVHIYRDPRDVVSSYRGVRWAPQSTEEAARWYRGLMERWFEVRERVPPGSFLEIPLEGLVSDTRRTLERVCKFWGLPWDESLLEADLSRSNSGRWKRDLSDSDTRAVHELLGRILEAYKYE